MPAASRFDKAILARPPRIRQRHHYEHCYGSSLRTRHLTGHSSSQSACLCANSPPLSLEFVEEAGLDDHVLFYALMDLHPKAVLLE